MLDLKAKLLAAGLVTKEQVDKVESEESAKKAKKKGGDASPRDRSPGESGGERWHKRVEELKAAPKSEQYEAIRGWVQRTRLDAHKGLPSDAAERFHFPRADGHISWLTLEPDLKAAVSEGKAGIIAFMSHNGLTHCVVPREVALDVGAVRREWVRVLDGFGVETAAPRTEETAPPADESASPAANDSASDSGS